MWNNFLVPRNVYNLFSDVNRNMKMCGLLEFVIRDFYCSFVKKEQKPTKQDKEFISLCYNNTTTHLPNEYTGILNGKNIILLQLEGMDTYLINSEITPTLFNLITHGVNFTRHYSFMRQGGSTFNSEFCVNVGFNGPFVYRTEPFSLNKNYFRYSLPRQFARRGYISRAFHMNKKEFYNRGLNYQSWGYERYYGLLDYQHYNDRRYELDRELVSNTLFKKLIFESSQPFLHYLITYSVHGP